MRFAPIILASLFTIVGVTAVRHFDMRKDKVPVSQTSPDATGQAAWEGHTADAATYILFGRKVEKTLDVKQLSKKQRGRLEEVSETVKQRANEHIAFAKKAVKVPNKPDPDDSISLQEKADYHRNVAAQLGEKAFKHETSAKQRLDSLPLLKAHDKLVAGVRNATLDTVKAEKYRDYATGHEKKADVADALSVMVDMEGMAAKGNERKRGPPGPGPGEGGNKMMKTRRR